MLVGAQALVLLILILPSWPKWVFENTWWDPRQLQRATAWAIIFEQVFAVGFSVYRLVWGLMQIYDHKHITAMQSVGSLGFIVFSAALSLKFWFDKDDLDS